MFLKSQFEQFFYVDEHDRIIWRISKNRKYLIPSTEEKERIKDSIDTVISLLIGLALFLLFLTPMGDNGLGLVFALGSGCALFLLWMYYKVRQYEKIDVVLPEQGMQERLKIQANNLGLFKIIALLAVDLLFLAISIFMWFYEATNTLESLLSIALWGLGAVVFVLLLIKKLQSC